MKNLRLDIIGVCSRGALGDLTPDPKQGLPQAVRNRPLYIHLYGLAIVLLK